MGWAIGYDSNWKRDIGYGVPAKCDHPDCDHDIDRGLAFVCGGEPYGGDHGCGLFFCCEDMLMVNINSSTGEIDDEHGDIVVQLCERCEERLRKQDDNIELFKPKPDIDEWIAHKINNSSWKNWRDENPDFVEKYRHLIIKSED